MDQEERDELEGKLYVLEEFIREMGVPHTQVTAFIDTMEKKEEIWRSSVHPLRFEGRDMNAVFKGMRAGYAYLERIFRVLI